MGFTLNLHPTPRVFSRESPAFARRLSPRPPPRAAAVPAAAAPARRAANASAEAARGTRTGLGTGPKCLV